MPNNSFTGEMSAQRETLKLLVGKATQAIEAVKAADQLDGQNKGEMLANMTIAMRHMEDAAMRFGKAIQACSGGVSPLGGPDTPNGGMRVPAPVPSPMGGSPVAETVN